MCLVKSPGLCLDAHRAYLILFGQKNNNIVFIIQLLANSMDLNSVQYSSIQSLCHRKHEHTCIGSFPQNILWACDWLDNRTINYTSVKMATQFECTCHLMCFEYARHKIRQPSTEETCGPEGTRKCRTIWIFNQFIDMQIKITIDKTAIYSGHVRKTRNEDSKIVRIRMKTTYQAVRLKRRQCEKKYLW